MQQVVDGLKAQAHAKLVLQDATEVLAGERRQAVLGSWAGFEPLLEADQFRPLQARGSAGIRRFLQRVGERLIVLLDPDLDRPPAATQHPADVLGAMALGGQDDGLIAPPESLVGDCLGQALQLFGGQSLMDMH